MAELSSTGSLTTNNDFDKMDDSVQHDTVRITNDDGAGGDSGKADKKREPEEALETHEVVEINKFTERKEWIEEKIKLLESMSPIEVFANVSTFASVSEELPPNLPTRKELDHWLEEHDKTEKETEIFDAEDMSKLKKLTKAATQRNLSPEDTDLIELTLTTLLALDKLLHLLRDRSEMLDLLGLRLTWEEQRIMSWKERRSLIEDLETFLSTRARWSLDTYEYPLPSTPTASHSTRFTSPPPSSPRPSSALSQRRGSTTSISSEASSVIGLSTSFSRSTRYKLAEQLSHDAALFAGRVTTLNHGKVMAAGKTLDKLIDASRKPVPDEILDEQDRLEDQAIKEVETVGKFAMAVVMQWKRADEHYNDTIKDQSAAQALILELDNAKIQHPTSRYNAAFMSRAQALTKRLAVKGDPSLPRSSFPRPLHPLFPKQTISNDNIVNLLSAEFAEAVKLAHQAELAAQEYNSRLEAVKRAEKLKDEMHHIAGQLDKVAIKLTKGVHEGREHGDASPPDLSKEACLDPTHHAPFLAILPHIIQEHEQADRVADYALADSLVASLRLKELPGISVSFKADITTTAHTLENQRNAVRQLLEDVLARAERLKEARRLWDTLNKIMDDVDDLRKQSIEGIIAQRWKPFNSRRDSAPITPDPDSPKTESIPLVVTLTPHAIPQRLDTLSQQLSIKFKKPFDVLSPSLEKPLFAHLSWSSDALSKHLDSIRGMVRLWEGIFNQAEAMTLMQRDAREIGYKIDTLQNDVEDARQTTLHGELSQEELTALEADLTSRSVSLQESVREFTDSLAARIPLVARSSTNAQSTPIPSTTLICDQKLNRMKGPLDLTLPFDLATVDNDVRSEGNATALKLAGGMQSLAKQLDYLRLSRLARESDHAMENLARELRTSEEGISALKASLASALDEKQSGINSALSDELVSMVEHSDRLIQDHRKRVTAMIIPVQQTVQALQSAPGAHDSPVHGTVIQPRIKAMDGALQRANNTKEVLLQLKVQIIEARDEENNRLFVEQERLATEEKARIERERLEAEDRARSERQTERRQEELRREAEKVSLEQERQKAKQIQLEQERQEEVESRARITAAEYHDREQVDDAETGRQSLVAHEDPVAFPLPRTPEEDVFGHRLVPSLSSSQPLSPELSTLRSRIVSLRTRLRALSLNSFLLASSKSNQALPSSKDIADRRSTFDALETDGESLPATVKEATVGGELRLFHSELNVARITMQRLSNLSQVCDLATACDHAFSDLLEHADTYPAAPSVAQLASTHVSDSRLPCEEQLGKRLSYSKDTLDKLDRACSNVADDPRVVVEQTRLQQTWSELSAMCTDRINGTRSRPASSISSVAGSTGLTGGSPAREKPKPSLSGRGPRQRAAPKESTLSRRSMSGTLDPIPRPSTNLSNRSVSGPSISGFSSLHNTTFASRQRTTSLASIQSATSTPFRRPVSPVTRPRTSSKRPESPTFSEVSGRSLMSTPSRSTWARAPRQSFGIVPRNIPGHETKRKAYIANPRSKLDIAVGHVVNNFRLPVTVQAVGDNWKDQSGKYWIGDAEPKLCFCRILRSQTVMVRVGGGWCELSKFLKGHFADLLAELPPSPPRKEERWINATTVREAMDSLGTVVRSPSTPEPKAQGLLPALQLSTPNATSPQSLKTPSSPDGSSPGLTPFQFMRRADPGLRPATPSPKSSRSQPVTPNIAITPSRTNIWRP